MRSAILAIFTSVLLLAAAGCGGSDDTVADIGGGGGGDTAGGGGDATAPADTGGGGAADGALGGACYANGTCNTGLECQDGTCVPEGGGGNQGGLGEDCYANGTCNTGLECQNGTCVQSGAAEGEEGGPCFGNGTCNAGLVCVNDVCQQPGAEGELGGPCYANGSCNAGLVCIDGVCVEPEPGSYAWEHPCQPGGDKVDGETCSDHCECESGYCYDEGYLNGFRFCTRRCDGFGYECWNDGSGVATYSCTNFSGTWVAELDPPVYLKNFCLKVCSTDAQCKELDPAWDGCAANWTEWDGHTISLPRTCIVHGN